MQLGCVRVAEGIPGHWGGGKVREGEGTGEGGSGGCGDRMGVFEVVVVIVVCGERAGVGGWEGLVG